MQHILTLSGVAVAVRHWFEIDLGDASMEHGARIELRELVGHPRRGSESAAQLITLDRPLWRADLMPYGGLKASGIGKEGPRSAVAEMTDVKTVILHGRPW